ncbi:hypothetical protein GWI33_014876 [Rhynchophorus ferrugineus]|uniref:C2H2-type domain-containing protein n=1 Tax=Rhynchophorus ferrugineus TaxID=354439 RepID=A0A834I0J9_RHYFE|nr:hypothetical protein GWI33_014876 [Rhynchophorus ferrugineus]
MCRIVCVIDGSQFYQLLNQDDVYRCSKCSKPYTKWMSYYVHMKYDCGQKRPWKCLVDNCRVKSTRTGTPGNPQLSQLFRNIKFVDRQCPICKKQFKRKDHVQRHYLEMHLSKENRFGYPCKMCNKVFKRKYLVDNHEKICLGMDNSIKCFKCDHMFYTKGKWLQHMRKAHDYHLM